MRKIQNIAFVLLATLFAGCINDHIENTLCRDGVLTLNLSTGATTRTDTPNNGVGDGTNDDTGDANYPEESVIYDVQFFLYPSGSGEDVNATFAGKIEVTPNVYPNHDTTEQTVTVPADVITTLCPKEGDTCGIYVIVNYLDQIGADLTTDLSNTSRAKLKSLPLNTELCIDDEGLYMRPTSFVMDSEVFTVKRGTGTDSNKLTSETIYVTRAAAKIMLEVNVQSTISVSGDTWQPVTEVEEANSYFARVSFYNGVKEGVIDDNSDTAPGEGDNRKDIQATTADPYYKVENIELIPGGWGADIVQPETTAVTRASSSAFQPDAGIYSYTSAWNDGDADAPYFKLSIPWRKVVEGQDDNAAWVTYDYTVPISLNTNQLVRNKLYLIRLNVGALGDLDYLDPAVYSYTVLDWEDVSMNAELARPQYLVVDKNYVEVFNENSYGVNYTASDAVTAEILSVIKPDYSSEIPVENNYIYGSEGSTSGATSFSPTSGNTNPFKVSVENGQIVLSHTLNNEFESDAFDYMPYTVRVKVTMQAGENTMVEYITFKQYPAIYIFADTNASFKSMDSENFNSNNNNPDNTFVNGINRNDKKAPGVENSPSSCGDVYGLYYNSNRNPNQYVITISALDSSLPYVIADSRSKTSDVTGLRINTIAKSYAVDYYFNLAENKRQLQYYYRTIEDHKSGQTSTTDPGAYVTGYNVAPKYRIASSYSVTSNTSSRETARRRCATYQENGYPAGRWRMPTYAEVAFICSMSERQMIPRLFDEGKGYWCAHGVFKPNGTKVDLSDSGSSISIRCVYDEWYWGSERLSIDTSEEPKYSQFVWGDMKIW